MVKFFLNKILIPAWDRKAVRRLKKYRTPESLCFDKNVKYGERDTERYDVIYPKEAKDSKNKLPVVLVIHGGGFIQGEKEQNEPFACEIAKRGFVVFNVEYTSKIGEGGVLLQLQDCALAAKAIYANLQAGINYMSIGITLINFNTINHTLKFDAKFFQQVAIWKIGVFKPMLYTLCNL